MEDNSPPQDRPSVWITYAWANNEGGDFDFLVQQLRDVGVDAVFDRVSLVPGPRLWEQIAGRIEDPALDGWAILLTRDSIESEACREELAYALDRALRSKGTDFPLIGLVHEVPIREVPTALRVRLLINLGDDQWPDLVLSGLRAEAPTRPDAPVARYVWDTIPSFCGPGTVAVCVRPRFGQVSQWRVFFPSSATCLDWGVGPPNPGGFTGLRTGQFTGNVSIQLMDDSVVVSMVGQREPLTSSDGGYVVLQAPLPEFVGVVSIDPATHVPDMDTLEMVNLRS